MAGIDSILGTHINSVLFREKRAEVLAQNLANVDTPNFKARDLDFKQYLDQISANQHASQLSSNNENHINASEDSFSANLLYRTPISTSLNGNTVDSQLEIGEYTENAIRYSASLNFLNSKVKTIITALRGD